MFLTVPRGLTKRVVIALLAVLLLAIAYLRFSLGYEHWYLSSGDRLLANIKFCMFPQCLFFPSANVLIVVGSAIPAIHSAGNIHPHRFGDYITRPQ